MKQLALVLASVLVVLFSSSVGGYQLPGASQDPGSDDGSEKGSSAFSPGHTTVWLKPHSSLSPGMPVLLERAVDGTKMLLPPAMLDEFTAMIRNGLQENGFEVLNPLRHGAQSSAVRIKPIVIRYDPGSAGARWLSPGLGATVCIIRATVVDPVTDDVIGEILSWRNIASGGLFTIGAHKYVPRHTAGDIGRALLEKLEEAP